MSFLTVAGAIIIVIVIRGGPQTLSMTTRIPIRLQIHNLDRCPAGSRKPGPVSLALSACLSPLLQRGELSQHSFAFCPVGCLGIKLRGWNGH